MKLDQCLAFAVHRVRTWDPYMFVLLSKSNVDAMATLRRGMPGTSHTFQQFGDDFGSAEMMALDASCTGTHLLIFKFLVQVARHPRELFAYIFAKKHPILAPVRGGGCIIL
jgi:hypothetical protein